MAAAVTCYRIADGRLSLLLMRTFDPRLTCMEALRDKAQTHQTTVEYIPDQCYTEPHYSLSHVRQLCLPARRTREVLLFYFFFK
jgi:hypothetical protein